MSALPQSGGQAPDTRADIPFGPGPNVSFERVCTVVPGDLNLLLTQFIKLFL